MPDTEALAKLERAIDKLQEATSTILFQVQETSHILKSLERNMAKLDSQMDTADKEISNLERAFERQDIFAKTIQKELSETRDTLKNLVETIDKKYVNKDEFGPIQKVVYGVSGLLLTAIIGAVMSMVFHK